MDQFLAGQFTLGVFSILAGMWLAFEITRADTKSGMRRALELGIESADDWRALSRYQGRLMIAFGATMLAFAEAPTFVPAITDALGQWYFATVLVLLPMVPLPLDRYVRKLSGQRQASR